MTWPEGPLLMLIALAWPLVLGLLAGHPRVRAGALRLLPLAPLPALVLALDAPSGGVLLAPDLLLGVVLRLDEIGALLLGMTAFLWLAAGLYAQGHMRGTRKPAVFTGFWCLTLTGNLGVCLAADMVTFYAAFAAVSLAAYFLVVHDGSTQALRAGRVYIILAVIGEAFLLLAFLIGAGAAGSMDIAAIRAALAGSSLTEAPLAQAALLLLVLGFGLKAGLVPLHVWLPLAHSAAPTPASAVLSGAIVNAGLIGLIRFLPASAEGWGTVLLLLGLFGAYAGAMAGLAQREPKVVLAYSTVSQMSLLVAVIGAMIASAGTMQAAIFYAVHHGLAKAALFLAVGVIAACGRHALPLVLAVTALLALSVAGLPLSGGALAKAAVKPAFQGLALAALSGTAVTTALVLARFLFLMAGRHAEGPQARPDTLMLLSWLLLSAAALAVPWLLLDRTWLSPAGALAWAALWDGIWPILLAALLAGVAVRARVRPPGLPPGDIVVPLERWTGWVLARVVAHLQAGGAAQRGSVDAGKAAGSPGIATWQGALTGLSARLEAALSRWQVAGLAVLVLALLVSVGAMR